MQTVIAWVLVVALPTSASLEQAELPTGLCVALEHSFTGNDDVGPPSESGLKPSHVKTGATIDGATWMRSIAPNRKDMEALRTAERLVDETLLHRRASLQDQDEGDDPWEIIGWIVLAFIVVGAIAVAAR